MGGKGQLYEGEFSIKQSCIVQTRLKLKDASWGMVAGMRLTKRR